MIVVPDDHADHPPDTPPSPSGLLVTAVVLAAVAGFLDAHLFLNVTEVFVANQSGNVVLLGMYVGEEQWAAAGGAAIALVAFGAGVIGATLDPPEAGRTSTATCGPTPSWAPRPCCSWRSRSCWRGPTPSHQSTPQPGHYPLLLVGGIAMGLQTVVLGRVGSISVATTYESGSVVRLGQEAVMVNRATSTQRRRHHLAVLRVLGCVIGSYSGRRRPGRVPRRARRCCCCCPQAPWWW